MSNSELLLGKTALITGCNRGIGRVVTSLFAQNGANLICCLRKTNEKFDQFVQSLREEHHIDIRLIYVDLLDETSIKDAFRPIVMDKQPVDILVNNAGIATGGLLQMTSQSTIKEVFQINFFAQVLITQLISKTMMRRKTGSIINMGSVAGLENFPGYTAYGSSKAALMAFTKTIANEMAPYNIRVNAIAPGLTDTGMAGKMEEKACKEMVNRTDFKRLGKPEEIANLVLFLASDKSSFMTGQIIRIDGGM